MKAERFRIPDVCVVLGGHPPGQIFTEPPFLCIEILSKDDRATDIQAKVEDYLDFGVPNVWIIDPRTRRGWMHTADGAGRASEDLLKTRDPEIAVPLAEMFAGLDD